MSGHPAELDLLRAAEGAPSPETAGHLERCEECGRRVEDAGALASLARRAYGEPVAGDLGGALERRMAEADRAALRESQAVAEGRGQDSRFRLVRGPLGGALAAAAVLVVAATLLLSGGGPVAIRACSIVPDRPAGVRDPLAPIASARSGEGYRVQIFLEEPGYVALFNLDTSGVLHLFFPFRDEGGTLDRFGLTEPLPADRGIEIPPAGTRDPFVLDAVPGVERFFVVASKRRIADRDVVGVLEEIGAIPAAERNEAAVSRRLAERFGRVRALAFEHLP